MLLIVEVVWPYKLPLNVERKIYYFENKHNFTSSKKCLGQPTRRDKHTKKLESSNYAGILPWKVLHHKGIENDQTIFVHVTVGNVKFAVSQWPNSHPFNFLYEARLYRGNTILEILNSKLKTNY